MKKKHLLAKLAVAAAATLLLLEGALQVLAYATWSGGKQARTGKVVRRGDGKVVLCIGDSFTFGMGASTPEMAYPSQLEKLLQQEQGPRWQVVNRGWPASDSYQLRAEIDAHLAGDRPDYLCVVVGSNDTWKRRGRNEQTGHEDAFVWKLRTLELLRVLLRGQRLFEGEAPADAANVDLTGHPLLGLWYITGSGQAVDFASTGTCSVTGSRIPWRPAGADLLLGPTEALLEARFEVHGETATVDLGGQRIELTRAAPPSATGGPPAGLEGIFHDALREERWADAVAAGKRVFEAQDRARALRVAPNLLRSALRTGDEATADAVLAKVREHQSQRPDEAATIALAKCLRQGARYAEAFAVTKAWLDSGRPASAELEEAHAEFASLSLPEPEALAILERAIERTGTDPAKCAQCWTNWARLYSGDDRRPLVKAMLTIWRLSPGSWMADQTFRKRGPEFRDEQLRTIALADGASEQDAARFIAAVRGSIPNQDEDWAKTLALHLEEINALAEKSRCRVIFGTYPRARKGVNETLRAVAAELGKPLVDVQARLPSDPNELKQYLVADGHCNDRGYGIMARGFADAIAELERAK